MGNEADTSRPLPMPTCADCLRHHALYCDACWARDTAEFKSGVVVAVETLTDTSTGLPPVQYAHVKHGEG